jgi:ABC-type transport system substrate-binding protein
MKMITSRVFTGLAAGALAVGTVAAMSAPAQAAAADYTPTGPDPVVFVGSNVSFTADEANQTLTCDVFDLEGSISDSGTSRAFGASAGTLDDLESSGCTNPIAGDTTVQPTGAWCVRVDGAEVGSVSPATLTSVTAYVSAAGCSFNVAGEVGGTFNDSTQVFTPTGSTLVIADNPVGFICAILGVAQGQSISVAGTWTANGLTITNP